MSVFRERVPSSKLVEGGDFKIDDRSGLMVLTAHYHLNRGFCCGNICRECPYIPEHIKGNKNLINK